MTSLIEVMLGIVAVALIDSSHQTGQDEAFAVCNDTNPVKRNPIKVINFGIEAGEKVQLSQEEKCNLYCYLQQVKLFDQTGNILGEEFLKYTVRENPETSNYTDVIVSQIFQIVRSTKGIKDYCHKAFLSYYFYMENIFTLVLANGLNNYNGVKEKIHEAMVKGEPLPTDLKNHVQKYLQQKDRIVRNFAGMELSTTGQTLASNQQSP